jgi:hypothetical protein
MIIGYEVIGFVVVLKGDVLLDRSQIVADVQSAGRLNAGKNPHVGQSRIE